MWWYADGSCAKYVLASARRQVDRKSTGSESAVLEDMCLQMGSVNYDSSGSMWGEGGGAVCGMINSCHLVDGPV